MTMDGTLASDALDRALMNSNALLRLVSPQRKFDSVALSLGSQNETRTVLHWLSVDAGEKDSSGGGINGVELFAIQALTPRTDCLLQEARDRLALKLPNHAANPFETLQTLGLALADRRRTRHYLPRQHERLPLLDVEEVSEAWDTSEATVGWKAGELKEIVIPVYWSDTYADQRTLFTTLDDSANLSRPVTGVYQLPASRLSIRPLPMAKEDRTVPPPSLIFHSEDLDDVTVRNAVDATTKAVKIGYTGRASRGQLMLLDETAESAGVDIRLCSASKTSSMFAEAQESLLASSLIELQSKHVLTHHSPKDTAASRESDPNTNKMDCWVEFRANIRNPKGFLFRRQQESPKTAKAPDLPYE